LRATTFSMIKDPGVIQAQIALAFVDFTMCMTVGYLTIRQSQKSTNESVLSHIRVFSAGLFLAMSFLALLPEAAHDLENTTTYQELGYALMILGYMLILSSRRFYLTLTQINTSLLKPEIRSRC